ncbi:hypothetical protein ACWEKT_24905 [Nocardia takedensis]
MNGEPEGPGTNELFEHGMAFVAAGDLDRAAESAHELAERGGDDQASTVFRAVIERFERIGDLERIPVCRRCAKPLTRACLMLIVPLAREGRIDEMDEYCAAVTRYCEQGELWDLHADFTELTGTVHWERGDHRAAIAAFAGARDHFRRSGAVGRAAWSKMMITVLRARLGEIEDARPALRRSLFTFARTANRDLFQRALLVLAEETRLRADHRLARHLFADVAGYADEIGDRQLAASARSGSADVMLRRAKFDAALTELGSVSDFYESNGTWTSAAAARFQAAEVEFARERYSSAEELVEQSRVLFARAGMKSALFSVELLSGRILGASGRLDDAAAAFGRAGRALADDTHDDSSAVLAAAVAGLDFQRGEFAAADRAFARAESEFQRLGQERSVMLCVENRANIAALRGDHATGTALIERACRYYESEPALRWKLAGTYRLLATLHCEAGRPYKALRTLHRARGITSRFGLIADRAKVDLAYAEVAITTRGSSGRGLDLALGMGIPAVLFLDGMRLAFPAAASRLAWRGHVTGEQLATVFDRVRRTGDRTFMAELIEATINSGVHTAARETADRRFGPLEPIPSADPPPIPDAPASVDYPPLGGGAALIAGAKLPMRPPPRLIMPDGRIALERYLKLADERYAVIPRPRTVRTW